MNFLFIGNDKFFCFLPLRMKPNVHLKKLLKINISPESSYPDMEIGLFNLKRIIRSTSRKEVIRGAIKKMLLLFYSKNRTAKSLALRYLSRINRYVEEVDTNIVHMFYSTDERINDLGVKFVGIFSRFFSNNDIIFYHIYKSNSKYRRKAIRSMIASSPRYHGYGKEAGVWEDLDLFGNIRATVPEEYFGRLDLSKLVELASIYPCLVRYFKFTDEFLVEEIKKSEKYDPKVLSRLKRILGVHKRENTEWEVFLECMGSIKRGEFDRSLTILRNIYELNVSSKYKIIFSAFIRKISDHLSAEETGIHNISGTGWRTSKFIISTSFEIKICGLTRNKVYRALKRFFNRGLRRISRK